MQFHVSLLFHHFCLREVLAGGFTSHLTSHKPVFHKKYSIKGQHFVNLFSYISSTACDLHTGSGVGASFLVSPKPSSAYVVSCCSGIGAVYMTSPEPSFATLLQSVDGFLHSFFLRVIFQRWPFACFCHKLTYNQLGGFGHSVFDTSVQLTEGRSARDQPKQPPAKKIWGARRFHHFLRGFSPAPFVRLVVFVVLLLFCFLGFLLFCRWKDSCI